MNIPETLPSGWVQVTVSQVAEIITGTTPSKADANNYGSEVPFVKPGDLLGSSAIKSATEYLSAQGVKNARLLPPGSVMVTCIGATIGKTGISGTWVATNQQINSLNVHTLVYEKFVFYYCISSDAQDWIKSNASSTTLPILNKSKFGNLPIPLAPLPEQRRIVAAIETHFSRLDAAVAKLKRIRANLKRYRAAVLKAACEGRLAPQKPGDEPADHLLARLLAERRRHWQAANPGKKYTEPAAPQTDGLPPLPKGWVWTTLDAISQVRTGVAKGRKFEDQIPILMPYLRVANVQDGFLDLSEVKTIEIRPNEVERYRLLPGDILFNEGGDRDKLGRGAIWNGELQDCIHQNHVFAVRLSTKEIAAKWINLVRQLSYARDYFWELASQTTNLASINSSNLRGLPIPLAPQSEQTRIVDEVERRLSVIDAMEKAVTADLQRAARLRQAILRRAFRGRLVAQDPTDEPAHRLLERIRVIG